MTRTPLSQSMIDTLQDALEYVMHIEAMVGYPQDYKVGTSSTNLAIMGLQN